MPITLDGSNGITTPTYGGADTSEYLVPVTAFKNRIINGAMVIDQRNAGASVTQTTSNLFVTDRWLITGDVASKFTAQQSTTAPAGFVNSLLITSSSSYSVPSGESYQLRQAIEGFNVADLGWGTVNAQSVTLSFWVRSSLTGTFGGSIRNATPNRSYPFSYTISAANTWEQKSITIAGDTSGTWVTNNGVGLYLTFSLGAGSSVSGTANTWAAASYVQPTGATSVVGTNGATFYITGVQLEVGSTATSFDYRPYTTELQLCQRYYETGQIVRYGGPTNINQGNEFSQTFLVSKRAAPTITYASTSFQNQVNAIGSSNITTSGFVATFGSSATGYGFGQGTMTASIEL